MEKTDVYNEAHLLQMLASETPDARDAFKAIYDEHAACVYDVARRYLGGSEPAKDLVQELFSTIWIKRSDFTHVQSFRGYVIKMTRSLALRYLKKALTEEVALHEFSERVQLPGDSELFDILDALIDRLPPRQQEIFRLAKLNGLSYEAIAQLLDISPNTVSNHMTAALKFIKSKDQRRFASSLTVLALMVLEAGC